MNVAIPSSHGSNELDSLIALGIPNRVTRPRRRVTPCRPEPAVASMARLERREAAAAALHGVAPVGEKGVCVAQAIAHLDRVLPGVPA